MVRDIGDGSGHFLHSKKGVNQGGPLAMISYDIGILPLIRELCTAYPHITQPWHEDGLGAGGAFDALQEHMRDFLARGTLREYFLEPTKNILVISLWNVQQAEKHF